MAADTVNIAPAHPQPGAADQAGNCRLGLALVVISMAQLMLVLDELIVNTALSSTCPSACCSRSAPAACCLSRAAIRTAGTCRARSPARPASPCSSTA